MENRHIIYTEKYETRYTCPCCGEKIVIMQKRYRKPYCTKIKWSEIDLNRHARDIAAELGCTEHTVRVHQRKAGLTIPRKAYHTKIKWDEVDLNRHVTDIARELGCSPQTVMYHQGKAGIKVPRKTRRTSATESVTRLNESIIKKYYHTNWSNTDADIARAVGVSRQAAYNRRKALFGCNRNGKTYTEWIAASEQMREALACYVQ